MSYPKITFGIIVLDGEPFTRYNLRSLYPFAYQIIVVEGACREAAEFATPEGHSQDKTLQLLQEFKAKEDPQGKLIIVTAEAEGKANGFWKDKTEQSRAYARRATGDWLWQVDIDEFYRSHDLQRICQYLDRHPKVTSLTFKAYHFWGGFDYLVDGGHVMLVTSQGEPWGRYRRIFKWKPGFSYLTHFPPTITDANGRNAAGGRVKCISKALKPPEVRIYHYFLVLPKQILHKGKFYEKRGNKNLFYRYKQVCSGINLTNRFKLIDTRFTRTWLERFSGRHPEQIQKLRSDIETGQINVKLRPTDDIERTLQDPKYLRMIPLVRLLELIKTTLHLFYCVLIRRPKTILVHRLCRVMPAGIENYLPASKKERFRFLHQNRTIR